MFSGNAGQEFSDSLQNITRQGGSFTFQAGSELNDLFRRIEQDPYNVAKIAVGEPWAPLFGAADAFDQAAKEANEIPVSEFTTPKTRRDIVGAVLQPELEDSLLEATSSRPMRRYLAPAPATPSDLEIVMRLMFGHTGLSLGSLGDIYRRFATQLRDTGIRFQAFAATLKDGQMSIDAGRRLLADWERITQTGRFIGTLLERRESVRTP